MVLVRGLEPPSVIGLLTPETGASTRHSATFAQLSYFFDIASLVRGGLEPHVRKNTLTPEASASANSAYAAQCEQYPTWF